MEASGGVKQRITNRRSPDRGRSAAAAAAAMTAPLHVVPRAKPFRRVQVVYYLTRNGQLEHPHYMEVSHLANQQLRLKDVMDRLTVLRGKGVPSLYSWSCKRSYKNGYVWNDLTENDVIYPSEGAEYVLKGSELIQGCSERFEQFQVSNNRHHQLQEPNFQYQPKRVDKPIIHNPRNHPPPSFPQNRRMPAETNNPRFSEEQFGEDEDDDDEDNNEEGEEETYTTSTTSANTPHSRRSRGVSTDEIEALQQPRGGGPHKGYPTTTELTLESHLSPPSASSTDGSKRFDEPDQPTVASAAEASPARPGRNSLLLHLIACGSGGGAVAAAGKVRKPPPPPALNVRKPMMCKGEAAAAVKEAVAAEEEVSCMSMNPRLLGRVAAAEKEYFSGSIAESIMERLEAAEPTLKKSSSYKEERSTLGGLGDSAREEQEPQRKREKVNKAVKARCIPRKKPSSSSSTKSKQEIQKH